LFFQIPARCLLLTAIDIAVIIFKPEDIMNRGISREQIERVARIYKSNQDASLALGITIRSFSRLCRKYEIESPYDRKMRGIHEIRQRRTLVAAG
jgi:uncharacterized protein YjhX (UPF0386 family)